MKKYFRIWLPVLLSVFIIIFCLIFLTDNNTFVSCEFNVNYENNVVETEFNNLEDNITTNVTKEQTDFQSVNSLDEETLEKLRAIINCDNKRIWPTIYQRGEYWVLENYVRADHGNLNCYGNVTYTTHGDFTFLDNLIPLISRWKAPLSIALYAPGTDFNDTINSIRYFRNCLKHDSNLVRYFVSFHLFFQKDHMPQNIPKYYEVLATKYDCNQTDPPFKAVKNNETYKQNNKLFYPVNVGRNVARDAATTFYILASDIELYPSLGLAKSFLKMIAKNEGPLLSRKPKVFPLAIFEVKENVSVPNNKTELIKMLKTEDAIRFHKKICKECHSIPNAVSWERSGETKDLKIFHMAKRTGAFHHWEPIYIGTKEEPYYDERLTWEGKSDKMTQGFALCVLDYEFLVLNNAFLVHRPGIKTMGEARRRELEIVTNKLINTKIFPELKLLYGERSGCTI